MELSNWVYSETEKKLIAQYASRIPERVIDSIAHLYRKSDIGVQGPVYNDGPDVVGVDVWNDWMDLLLGGSKKISALFVAPPTEKKEQIDAANAFVVDELKTVPHARGLVLVAPDSNRDRLENILENTQIRGVKTFCTYCDYVPDFEAPLEAFLPEWIWQTANDHKLVLLIFLMKKAALNAPENFGYLLTMCQRYPNARVLLGHGARGFCAHNTVSGIKHLAGLKNIYVDCSNICEPLALISAMRVLGPERLLFASDFPLSQTRGKATTVGDGFVWMTNRNFNWDSYSYVCNPTLIGVESLRNLFDVCDIERLSRADVEKIFSQNAEEMLAR
jgi:glutamate-1-semialdehyde 2,1-aminomutase